MDMNLLVLTDKLIMLVPNYLALVVHLLVIRIPCNFYCFKELNNLFACTKVLRKYVEINGRQVIGGGQFTVVKKRYSYVPL